MQSVLKKEHSYIYIHEKCLPRSESIVGYVNHFYKVGGDGGSSRYPFHGQIIHEYNMHVDIYALDITSIIINNYKLMHKMKLF